ncbi:MAG: protein translocase subunit secA, partial [Deltaproteobacteria bacterium]|nr:protein translocase subunit secA [Deltaproteobacteria bacterium]
MKVKKAEARYVKEGEIFDRQRGDALKRSTELQREVREVSPFRELRQRYEDLSATTLIEALHGIRAIPEGYLKGKEEFESALLEDGNGRPAPSDEEFAEARRDFTEAIARWQQNVGEREAIVEALDEKRRNYEQRILDLEFLTALSSLAEGEHAALAREYETVRQAYEEAERRCEEIRKPYEETIQSAQDNYESKRQEYLRMVEEVREQLDKAPDEYRHRFDEILKEYNQVCAGEREQVITAGGLHILGTERHESRRIDNQLRGRSGRQGDPGSSRFFLSLQDDLMRIFGADRIQGIMARLGMEEGVPIEHGLVTRAIENAQKKVEAHNFDIRKHLLEYDDVMNKQREVIYSQRREVLKGETLKEEVLDMARGLAEEVLSGYADKELHPSEWDLIGLREGFFHRFNLRLDLEPDKDSLTADGIADLLAERAVQAYEDKEKRFGSPMLRQ